MVSVGRSSAIYCTMSKTLKNTVNENKRTDSTITAGRPTTHCQGHWEYTKYQKEIQTQHTSNKDTTLIQCATTNHIKI